MLEMIGLALKEVLYYPSILIRAIFGSSGYVYLRNNIAPLFWIGVAITLIFVVIKIIRSATWGS